MKIKPIVLSLSLLAMSAGAFADDDCTDPVADWQPRENLRLQLEEQGWTVQTLKVPTDRPSPHWFYLPALLLAALVWWAQGRRLPAAPARNALPRPADDQPLRRHGTR